MTSLYDLGTLGLFMATLVLVLSVYHSSAGPEN